MTAPGPEEAPPFGGAESRGVPSRQSLVAQIPGPKPPVPSTQPIVEVPGGGGQNADRESPGRGRQDVSKARKALCLGKQRLGSDGGQESAESVNRADETKERGDHGSRLQEGLTKAHLPVPILHPDPSMPVSPVHRVPPLSLKARAAPPPEDPKAQSLQTHRQNGHGKKKQNPACRPLEGSDHTGAVVGGIVCRTSPAFLWPECLTATGAMVLIRVG